MANHVELRRYKEGIEERQKQFLCNVVPSRDVCREIGPVLWKIGSTDFVNMSKEDAIFLMILANLWA